VSLIIATFLRMWVPGGRLDGATAVLVSWRKRSLPNNRAAEAASVSSGLVWPDVGGGGELCLSHVVCTASCKTPASGQRDM
jgi:hypothetical protein